LSNPPRRRRSRFAPACLSLVSFNLGSDHCDISNNDYGSRDKLTSFSKMAGISTPQLNDNQTNRSILRRNVLVMKVGFICINLPGHLNPMTALARQLQARNHEVVVACRRKIRANVNLMS
jgi:hypothetical protein